jgi:hypothetical protein
MQKLCRFIVKNLKVPVLNSEGVQPHPSIKAGGCCDTHFEGAQAPSSTLIAEYHYPKIMHSEVRPAAQALFHNNLGALVFKSRITCLQKLINSKIIFHSHKDVGIFL